MKFSLKTFLLTTFILLEIAALSAFPGSPDQGLLEKLPADPVVTTPNKLVIEIYFGRRGDCEGWGICKVSIGFERTQANSGIASIYPDKLSKNKLILEIDKARGISAEQYQKYFKSGTFVIEENYPIPSEILRELGLPSGNTILEGKYPVTERNGIIYVTLTIK